MGLDYYVNAVLSPHFVAAMALAGIGYGATLLWQLNLHEPVRLYLVAVLPGLAFLAFVFLSRLATDGAIILYPLLIIDWLVYSNAAVATVWIRRYLMHRRRK